MRTLLAPGHVESRGRRRRVIAVMVAVLAVVVLVVYGRYELSHDLPNPYWGIFGTSYTYTFEAGPPGVGLVETRPDEIVSRFIHDYIGVAGTFPCVASLATYGQYPSAVDPIIRPGGGACAFHRPVAAVHIETTHVDTFWRGIPIPIGAGEPAATVSYRIDYTDGEHLEGNFQLIADLFRSQPYFRTRIHANCWFFSEALGFYPNVVAEPPRGLEYFTSKPVIRHCAGFV